MIYILNNKQLGDEIRQISALTLKGIMERSFTDMDEDEIKYFKAHVLDSYLSEKVPIRKAISNLINSFLRIGGIESWPDILRILAANLDSDMASGMSLETLNIIIEDSGPIIEEKYSEVYY